MRFSTQHPSTQHPAPEHPAPNAPREDFQEEVDTLMTAPPALDEINATLLSVLRHLQAPHEDVQLLLEAIEQGAPVKLEEDASRRAWLEAFRHRFDQKS